jgi:hypothetical protein
MPSFKTMVSRLDRADLDDKTLFRVDLDDKIWRRAGYVSLTLGSYVLGSTRVGAELSVHGLWRKTRVGTDEELVALLFNDKKKEDNMVSCLDILASIKREQKSKWKSANISPERLDTLYAELAESFLSKWSPSEFVGK